MYLIPLGHFAQRPHGMPTLLRIDASSRTLGSLSRDLGDHAERAWLDRHDGGRVVRRDLAETPLPHIANETIAGFYTDPADMTDALREATALSDHLIDELESADAVLLTVPMYNFSVPSALKAWVDQVVRIGRTFSYDGESFTGLVTGKPAYIACAFGAAGYGPGEPLASADFVRPYLEFLLGFLGFEHVQSFAVEATTSDQLTVARNAESVKTEVERAFAPGALAS